MAKTDGAAPPDKPAKIASPARVAAFRTGLSAEARAAAWLMAKGYRILAKRFRTPHGEIDLVTGSHKNDDLALRRVELGVGGQHAERTAIEGFVELRELTADDGLAIAEHRGHVGQALRAQGRGDRGDLADGQGLSHPRLPLEDPTGGD